MTKKHFEAIAQVLSAELAIQPAGNGRIAVLGIMYSLADKFVQENPRFDRERFYKAVRG